MDPEATAAVTAENKSAFGTFVKQLFSFSGDLSQLTCPAFMLNGLSLLDYSTHWGDYPEYFADIAAIKGTDAAAREERLRRIVKWFMSTLYGSYHARCKNGQEKKPFNPILGEQLFTSWANGNRMVIEQVCHHPPITAFYLENKKENICLNGHCGQKTKFKTSVASISVQQTGIARVDLPSLKESYTITFPELFVRGLLSGSIFLELCGAVRIRGSNGYAADLDFVPKGWISGEYHGVKGKLYHQNDAPFAGISGKWMDTVQLTGPDLKTVTSTLFHVDGNPPPARIFKPLAEQGALESERIWGKCAAALHSGDGNGATKEKQAVEDEQRRIRKEREAEGIVWAPVFFKSTKDKEPGQSQEVDAWVFNESLH